MKGVVKLASFFDQELKSGLKDLVITYANNRYELFGRYRIDAANGEVTVLDSRSKERLAFSSLKNAVVYCTLSAGGKYAESRRLQAIDLKLLSLQIDIQVHRNLVRSAESDEAKFIYVNKLREDSYKKRLLTEEINSYINSSKVILEAKLSRNFN